MKLKDQNVLFLTRTMALGGTENVILQLCEILKPKVHKIIVCSSGGVNEEKLESMGILHIKIGDIEDKNPICMYRNFQAIKKIVKEEHISVIHSHHRMAAMYANFIGGKHIVRIANAHNTFHNKKILTRIAYRNTSLIAVGEMVKKNLEDYFHIPSIQIMVIHNAIKPFEEDLVIDKKLERFHKKGYTIVGNVGRLSEQKGMKYFIEAIDIVKKKNNMVKYVIVGSGEDEAMLKAMIEEKSLKNDVFFFGYRSDIQNIMSQLDFVVLSSLWEGLPLTPIEAFSVGKTIVATAVDGTVEIVQDGVNGILVEARDVISLADGILTLVENKKVRSKMEKNALMTYRKEFSFQTLSEQYIEYYDKI